MQLAKSLATVLILALTTPVDAAPINQLGYSRPVPQKRHKQMKVDGRVPTSAG
jgi:hypothetical protein